MKRRIILIGIAIVMAAGSVFAQTGAPSLAGKARAKQVQSQCGKAARRAIVKRLLKQLDLTADQKAKIRELNKQAVGQIKAVKADTSLTLQQKIAKVREIRKAEWQQIKGLLTPEQLQKLQDLIAKAKQRRNK